jgi:hypothetical protein
MPGFRLPAALSMVALAFRSASSVWAEAAGELRMATFRYGATPPLR